MSQTTIDKRQAFKKTVDDYFIAGYCCSEAIVMATADHYVPQVSPEIAQATSTGLCGGMGGRQGTCGVFSGGAVAIGLVLGKGIKKDKHIKQLSARYYEQLKAHAGGQACQQLLDKMGIMNWNGSRCRRLTCEGAELLQSILDAELDKQKHMPE